MIRVAVVVFALLGMAFATPTVVPVINGDRLGLTFYPMENVDPEDLRFVGSVDDAQCRAGSEWSIPTRDTTHVFLTIDTLRNCLQNAPETYTPYNWIAYGLMNRVKLSFNFIGNAFLTSCASNNEPASVRWYELTTIDLGEVIQIQAKIEGVAIPDVISARHSRFGLMTMRRSGESNLFTVQIDKNDRPVYDHGDHLFIITHTPITCHTLALGALAAPKQQEKQVALRELPSTKLGSAKAARQEDEAPAPPPIVVNSPGTVNSEQCVIFARRQEDIGMAARILKAEVCYRMNGAATCKKMSPQSYVRKLVPQDRGMTLAHLPAAVDQDFCVLDIVSEVNKLIRGDPLALIGKEGQVTTPAQWKQMKADIKTLTYENELYAAAEYQLQLKYTFINATSTNPRDFHINSGGDVSTATARFSIHDGKVIFGAPVQVKRNEHWHNETDNNNTWVVQDEGFPLWATILLICILAGLLVFVMLVLIWDSQKSRSAGDRYVLLANQR